MEIVKRDGRIVEFERNKVENAILKAMKETEKGVDSYLASCITTVVIHKFKDKTPTVEEVQDEVERWLAEKGRFDASKQYILYRTERAKLRDKGWDMTELQRDIYEQKYKLTGETFNDFVSRVGGDSDFIRKAIRDKKFLPAGRILAGRGLKEHGKSVTLSNCYVMPKVEDNIESIFDTAKYLARTYSFGGGCGVNISKLRPDGAKVQNSAQTTSGATSFMDLYSMVTGIIGQRGRRGALMINIDVNHPDIQNFIDIKNGDNDTVRFANISVNMTNEFMKSVSENKPFELYFDVEATRERISKIVDAKEVYHVLAKNNWNSAEPGILFKDRIDNWHLMSEDKFFEYAGVNPCAEEPLPAFGSCNLASINLAEFVDKPFTPEAKFNYYKFEEMVKHGVIYLNEVLDENMDNHPLPQQKEVSRDLRQIGLGVMGLADMFIKMGVKYGSLESVELSHMIGHRMINSALEQSALLAKEFGTFPKYDREAVLKSPFYLANTTVHTRDLVEAYGLRNSQLLTIAPTGSISTMIGVSGGMEPIFQIAYTRKSETLHSGDTYYKVFTPIAKEYMELKGLTDEKDLPDYFITSGDIDYVSRIDVQSAWQQYIDASISSTVNLPESATVADVEQLYLYAWRKGLKGITIYRDGCQRTGILTTTETPKKGNTERIEALKEEMDKLAGEALTENPNVCPMCGGEMFHSGGCTECHDCGYSPCSI